MREQSRIHLVIVTLVVLLTLTVSTVLGDVTITQSLIGAKQIITFSNDVQVNGGNTCADLLTEITHLGTDYTCSLDDPTTLVIKYGYSPDADPQTITLTGLNETISNGAFTRPTLPTFTITETGITTGYQDNTVTLTASPSWSGATTTRSYAWSYGGGSAGSTPDISGAGNSFTFNYWLMTPGTYNIEIRMSDTDTSFYYDQTKTLIVQDSCVDLTSCNVVGWKLTNNPGSCTGTYITGINVGNGDDITLAQSGSGPYILTATYNPGSVGGNALSIDDSQCDNSFTTVSCGSTIQFPTITETTVGAIQKFTFSQLVAASGGSNCADFLDSTTHLGTGYSCSIINTPNPATLEIKYGYSPAATPPTLTLKPAAFSPCAVGNFTRTTLPTFTITETGITTGYQDNTVTLTASPSWSGATTTRSYAWSYGGGSAGSTPDISGAGNSFTFNYWLMTPGTYNIEIRMSDTDTSFYYDQTKTLIVQDSCVDLTSCNVVGWKLTNNPGSCTGTYITGINVGNGDDITLAQSGSGPYILTATYNPGSVGGNALSIDDSQCDNSFTTVSCGSTIQFPTITETTVGAIQKFTFSQLVAASGGSNCADFLDSTTHLGTGYSCSIINTPNPATLEIKYGYSPAATPPTLTLKPAAFSPCAVGNFTRTTLPTFTITETGITTGYQDNTVTLTASPSWSGATTTRSYAWSYGGGSAGSTPDISGAGNSFTFNYWLMTPGTYNIEIRMSDTDTSFYYDQTKTLIVQDSCVDLTSCNVVGWKLTNNPGSCTGTYITGINVGNGDDITLAQSGSGPYILTATYNPGSVGGNALSIDDSQCDNSFTTVSCGSTIQFPTITETTVGAIQKFTFSQLVAASGGSNCADFLDSTTHLGTGYSCSIINTPNPATLEIKYGYSPAATPPTLTLKPAAFSPCAVGNFTRTTLPTFTITETGITTGYQDNTVTLTASPSWSGATTTRSYAWSYGGGSAGSTPDISGAGNSFTFNYWLMTPGTYNIEIRMSDTDTSFYYDQTKTLIVQDSCVDLTSCNVVGWKLTNNPGSCTGTYITGINVGNGDDITLAQSGSGPYILTATYNPGSVGGNALSIDDSQCDNSFTTVSCGSTIQFPTITETTVGAIQKFTFSQLVAASGGSNCADFLDSTTHLGTGYSCSIINTPNPATLEIKYGYSPAATPPTLTLKPAAFSPCAVGNFTRTTLPTFTITETGITTGYQDNTVTLTASPSWSGATTTRSYAWSYGGGSAGSTPDISGAGNSFTFNYWLMTPGTYNIEIRMSDTDTSFYYDQTKTLIVQDSCVDLTSCNVVGWKLTNNPGSCTGTYITGINVGNGDDITLAQSGSGPYILTATYNPGSVGGNALSIDDSQCDNSFTTVSCGSTIQFPTITETTVGAIQKFTFSQLVAASGGSNCADFLDSTTHLGTGYSCSIINTPNPATLEIKYGYSPAATPPTLTLKPAAFSPCAVGNFTRTTLPTFTITETGITTGYQDNTVTLTASPSWSGATTTRSYAWSYGGGSAGSTPDISGAGNSFTFNYWLMTPGTYNIEIRMSDTDTSFYYDQTKTLIVQDSCVDLTSCNVVGWKLTNNPGSCTGTYITGINVGNGDDITLAQSGSGPYILTATYNPGSVGGNALSIDDSQCDNSFTTVSCGSTIQFPTITETTVGAIQKFTFSQLVAASGGSNCADFLDSTTHLGTGYSCSIINTPNPATLEIKYGYSPAATPPTLTLKPAAFSPCAVGNFTRTTLPTFTITETGITTGYQDNTVTLTASPSWSGATTTRSYAWSYGGGSAGSTPDISGAGNSFTFNYWLMTPGTYNIEIRMSDTDTSFYYDQTKTLIVQDSCVDLTSCNVVGWKLTNNPGSCTGTYITGINVGNGDDITLAQSGSGPYILTATYNPGSVGGNALSIDDSQCDNSFTTVSCGSTIQFPTITETTVGAIQKFTFSQLVAASGGSNCADFLDSTTHLGTGYSCSIINTPNPATLEIKYGYSPAATPPTLTLKPAAFSPCAVGNFTRTTLPTFTITETGITTGYQDNTVTLTASPSWSGATTTRSYAWSYGGGSAGSTPDISGAGNSFTFNYWLMTPGTYNIEIRMSDTDTSFYYDQTKTLIVQDSCVDLTSCNVVGWKLTNNPGSCTGTYITGINVGNGDDITLAQSGSGPYILTATYNPGSVGGNALSIDDSQCDNSFTTVSCGSTIQFPTITETTVGAIQKFTFSQLVAASGGSNCADFLDSTTHLGTGYSCSIINTPNPATLEIKYGYSPAATPPTLTLKPAAFSPCAVGNFTRTTLPTFTITETGITTGYQDNTVTLTASPSWSGATTTRSYAWSYGGGSAGSTPDISGAGNSFTFNYWLMTPGTYNIEIRMSDTDTSFYYDQTKTLIVQDSCVDLTSCNVVGWKLTNNPGSCTGTYITGINVGNGDDITLAQSGSGPYILTATYNPGSVGGNALSIDDSQCDNSFTTVSCGSTIQFPTITETTVGAIQKFTFSQLVAASGGSNCADFLDSTTHLGTGYSCSIINTPNPATLEIKYGYSPAATPPTLTLKPAAFSPCAVGNFTRTTLPTFTITETGITTGYQDNTVTLTASPSWSGATTTRSYAWSYGGGSAGSTPDISGAGNSFTFNYWLMTPGTYNIEIRMSDTDTSFYYDQTKTLIVQDSCVDLTSCNVVGWKLTNNPGSCTGTYITGINVGNGDDITLAQSGSGPYILTATYNPGSVGGNALSIDDSQCDNSFTTVSCGSTIQFPTITETTVGAIQKFTFSQLVAASGGSNCADFLDSTTHLGTGYSCSIINTPNPATLEIKYGYSPAATPPTLTLKPAAFSPCAVGNFTRTTLPTFTITETGITTGYQDNTVTLTASPSWSGATTTRSYAWSYGGGSAGSTPDISGAGNSFTFNYWLMTPGTYNIEIRMSDTDTSFYYDQTKTLIVQDSCVDLTSCNVVGWKLTNNPGSCTGTYITGINVGNGDDITLAQSGSGPYILTATYNPGSVGGNALSIDDSQCDNSFTTVSCGSTIQFPTITETTVGAIQKFTFSQLVAASGGSNCADFLDSTTHLGTGYSCSIINTPNPATLEIKYGYSPAATPPTLTLKPAAFSPCAVGNFTRTTLPTFTITETGITTGYQDNTVTLTASPSWSGATTTRSYAWSYGGGSAGSTPDISGAGNSFTFNYWLMTPGTYNIEIRMSDTDTSFYYDQTKTLIVQDSCVDLTSCNVVGWKLTNNPGSCTGTYITGINVGNGDDITLAQSGSGPYILTATYNPGSVGGNALSIDDSQCDNSFTTVSCGSTIQFPTITETTVGAIQKFTFSQLVAASGGSNCADFLDSTTHLGTGYSCSIINTPNPATLEIKYGYSPAATPPTLTLKPAAFSPCAVGNFTRSSPTFTITETGVTTGYQDNTVTLTISPSWSGATTTRLYAWSYGGGSAGSTPDISGAGNSFTFNYWLMTPGTYNIEIRMSDTDTSFYYDQTKTLIVQDSCVDLTSCNVVGWKLTNNPGSCTGTYITGINVGNGDDITLAQSGSGPYILTATYNPGSVGGNALSIDDSQCDNSFTTVSCGSTIQFPTITETTVGAIQKFTFSQLVAASGGSNCADFLDSTTHLGTGYSCSIINTPNPATLEIKYGYSPAATPPTLTLKPAAFSPCAVGNFTRSSPTFTITESDIITAYQDHTATLTASVTWNGPTTTRSYSWSYTPGSAGSTPILSGVTAGTYDFNYWLMSPGSHSVNIKLLDSDNPTFYYEQTSSSLEVQDSCLDLTACDVVGWKLSHNPGACYDEYVTGIVPSNGDVVALSKWGINPYRITATYQPGSQGGNSLTIDSSHCFNTFTTVSCGLNIKFPSLAMNTDSPTSQSSGVPLTISGTLNANGLSSPADYSLPWTPSGAPCVDGSPSCTIDPGDITCSGTPYEYKLLAKISCKVDPWKEITFTPFTYGTTFTKQVVGSVQTFTFSEDMTPTGGTSCADLLTSTLYLGVGFSCSLPTPTTFLIKYGHSTVEMPPKTISINLGGFTTSCITTAVSFKRPIIPSFDLAATGISEAAYQDNVAAFRCASFKWFGSSATKVMEWSYITSAGTIPDLTSLTATSFDFNYWEMTPGSYQIKVRLTDTANPPFYYEEDSPVFTVLESCSASCDVVNWTLTHDPGTCESNCLSNQGTDSLLCTQETKSNSYVITGTYQPGSVGSRTLTTNSGKCTNSFTTVSCGTALKFPKIELSQDAPAAQYSGSDLTISGSITDNGLILDTDYTVTWVQPTDFTTCVSGSSTCTVLAESLTCGGPYAFATQLKMLCQGSPVVWSAATYTEFTYGSMVPYTFNTTSGTVQKIIFSQTLAVTGGSECSDLLVSTSHLGNGYSCNYTSTLDNSTLNVRYGNETVPGNQTISLKPAGFTPCTAGSFDRPQLPSFNLSEDGVQDSAYQDSVATFTITSIIWTGSTNTRVFYWNYVITADNNSLLNGVTGESYQFNYWLMGPGEYQIKVIMKDTDNWNFSYQIIGKKFIILESCNNSAGLAELEQGVCTLCDAAAGFSAIGKECINPNQVEETETETEIEIIVVEEEDPKEGFFTTSNIIIISSAGGGVALIVAGFIGYKLYAARRAISKIGRTIHDITTPSPRMSKASEIGIEELKVQDVGDVVQIDELGSDFWK